MSARRESLGETATATRELPSYIEMVSNIEKNSHRYFGYAALVVFFVAHMLSWLFLHQFEDMITDAWPANVTYGGNTHPKLDFRLASRSCGAAHPRRAVSSSARENVQGSSRYIASLVTSFTLNVLAVTKVFLESMLARQVRRKSISRLIYPSTEEFDS